MEVSTSIGISKPKEHVWKVITDIENAQGRISSIIAIDVLEKPETGFVGFKWRPRDNWGVQSALAELD